MSISLIAALSLSLFFWQAQKAHVHGAAAVNLAMEGKKGELEFEAPAEGILGFERAAKTAAEKKAVADALAKFRGQAAELFQLPAAAGCKLTPKEVDIHQEGAQHAEVHAHYDVLCQKEPNGNLVLGIFKSYPKLQEVSVTFVSDAQQKSGKVTAAKPNFTF